MSQFKSDLLSIILGRYIQKDTLELNNKTVYIKLDIYRSILVSTSHPLEIEPRIS